MISIAVHGGAWDISEDLAPSYKAGITNALRIGWEVLTRGGSAVEAVEASVVAMEDDDVFDAGRGSFVNAAGEVELDAAIMDGKTLRAGAVAAVQRIRNPVVVARKIMEESEHVLLVGMGAVRFAREHGIPLCRKDDLIVPRELERWRENQRSKRPSAQNVLRGRKVPADSVGAVARDRKGNVASASSTGGVPNKAPGRVGDAPLIGCGTYADNEAGAVCATGWGESMIRVAMAKTIIDLMKQKGFGPAEAGKEGLRILRKRVGGFGGLLILSREGEVGTVSNTPRMARGIMTSVMKSPAIEV